MLVKKLFNGSCSTEARMKAVNDIITEYCAYDLDDNPARLVEFLEDYDLGWIIMDVCDENRCYADSMMLVEQRRKLLQEFVRLPNENVIGISLNGDDSYVLLGTPYEVLRTIDVYL